jgi:hypothetical protein
LGPFPFASAIKCHQKSTCNSAGSSVGSLAHTRATPRLGGAAVSCQYFPCSFVLAPRAPALRLGVQAPLPLRASSRRGVLPARGLPGWPNALPVSSVIHPRTAVSSFRASWLQIEIGSSVVPRAPRRLAVVQAALLAKLSHARRHIGALRALSRQNGSPSGEFGRLHTVFQTAVHFVSLTAAYLFT